MPDNPPRNAFGSMLSPSTTEQRTGPADRRSTSPAGDRLRARAAAFHALADVNGDMSGDAESDYMTGYGEGAAGAYRACAEMIEQLANEEDAR